MIFLPHYLWAENDKVSSLTRIRSFQPKACQRLGPFAGCCVCSQIIFPLNFLDAAWKHAGYFLQNGKFWEIFKITMQLSQFQLKLKIFPLLHRHDHFVFTREFLKVSTLCNHR